MSQPEQSNSTVPAAPAAAPEANSAPDGWAAAGPGDRAADQICVRETIDSLRLEGVDFLREMVDLFKAEVPKGVRELGQALDGGDSARVTIIAHTLKGTAGIFGATRMRALAGSIERAARAGSVEKAIVEKLRSECERVRQVLEAEVSTPPA
ncbi:MAG: Hpt domain-containing protein [Candidatus Binataceae bacterium]